MVRKVRMRKRRRGFLMTAEKARTKLVKVPAPGQESKMRSWAGRVGVIKVELEEGAEDRAVRMVASWKQPPVVELIMQDTRKTNWRRKLTIGESVH